MLALRLKDQKYVQIRREQGREMIPPRTVNWRSETGTVIFGHFMSRPGAQGRVQANADRHVGGLSKHKKGQPIAKIPD